MTEAENRPGSETPAPDLQTDRLGPGFDSPAKPKPTSLTTAPSLTSQELDEALKESTAKRGLRATLFYVFGFICALELLLFPVGVIWTINTERFIETISEGENKAIVAAGVMVAMVGAIPLTIFITLARLVHTPPAGGETGDGDGKFQTALTSLISSAGETLSAVKELFKK